MKQFEIHKMLRIGLLIAVLFLLPFALQQKAVTESGSRYSLVETNIAYANAFTDFVSNVFNTATNFLNNLSANNQNPGSGNQTGGSNNNIVIRNIQNVGDLAIHLDDNNCGALSSNSCSYTENNGVYTLNIIVPNGSGSNVASPCTTAPDLQVANLFMTNEAGTDKGSFDEKRIPLGSTVRMYEAISNESCASTHSRKADGSTVWQSLPVRPTDSYNLANTQYQWSWADDTVNTPPFGDNGSFPITYEVDWNSRLGDPWTADETFTQRDTPAMFGWSTAERFRKLKMDTLGTHRLRVTADPLNTCTANAGCIREGGNNNDNNSRTEEFTVVRPWIALQSFYTRYECNFSIFGNCVSGHTDATSNAGGNREVTNPNATWGLSWYSLGIDMTTCVGDSRNLAGNDLNDFDGKVDRINTDSIHNRVKDTLNTQYYDADIKEPVSNAHTYTMTCTGIDGGTYSDTVVLYNNVPNDEMDLEVHVEDRGVKPGKVISNFGYTVRNNGLVDAQSYNHRARVSGVVVAGPVDINATIQGTGAWFTRNVSGSWTVPATPPVGMTYPYNLPYSVCVIHPDNKVAGQICGLGKMIVSAIDSTQCSDGVNNDSDGDIDYPDDAGCSSGSDDDEDDVTQCSDGIDNDGDGQTDHPNDPGCTSSSDDSEINTIAPTITANDKSTSVTVRKNEEVKIEWNDGGNSGCTLSGNLSVPVDVGEEKLKVQNQSIFSIDCGAGGAASVTVNVLPEFFET